MNVPRLTSKAEIRRQHESELREITEQIDYYVDRARSLRKDLRVDLPESRDVQARVATATQHLEMTVWLLKGARRVL